MLTAHEARGIEKELDYEARKTVFRFTDCLSDFEKHTLLVANYLVSK